MADDAPERIGLISDGLGMWALAQYFEADVAVHYIRADLHPAAQPEGQEPMAWQPIETAPRDGATVILWVIEDHDGSGHMLWPCSVIHDEWCWQISDNRNLDYDYEIIERCTPTHWMPLPSPPRSDMGGGA